ncbi:MAG: hypothetical protein OXU20_30325 [Myxococcales bacterium]|nr:hypothetical protein [Myxococcales bacterium]
MPPPDQGPTGSASAGTERTGKAPPTTEATTGTRAEALWKRRDNREALEQAIAIWEQLAATKAGSPDLALKLARGYFTLGHSVNRDAAATLFDKGARAARTALSTESVAQTAQAARHWSLANRAASAFAGPYLERVDQHQELLEEARALRDSLPTAVVPRPEHVLASLLATPPLLALRDLETSRELFAAMTTRHPHDLAARVAFARHYGVAAQDIALFEAELRQVLAAPETGPDDRLAKAAAGRLLKLAPHLFE